VFVCVAVDPPDLFSASGFSLAPAKKRDSLVYARPSTPEADMSPDILKTLTVSLTSSLCTAFFVVACTAGAEKWGAEPPPAAPDNSGGGGGDGDGSSDDGGDDGGDDPGDGGNDGDGLSAEDLAAVEADIASIKCFIGHMTDDQSWWSEETEDDDYPGYWEEIIWNRNYSGSDHWKQGPNSDASKAYDDCF